MPPTRSVNGVTASAELTSGNINKTRNPIPHLIGNMYKSNNTKTVLIGLASPFFRPWGAMTGFLPDPPTTALIAD